MAGVDRRLWYAVATALVVGAIAFVLLRRHPEVQVADLVAQFAQARKQPGDGAFEIGDVTIDGQTKRSIAAEEQTRLTFHVTVPDHGWLKVALALKPDAWTPPGGGALLFVGISDGRSYHDAVSIVIDPDGQPADRRWHDVLINLEEYAGLTIDLIFNTRAGHAPPSGSHDAFAVWGAPAVVTR